VHAGRSSNSKLMPNLDHRVPLRACNIPGATGRKRHSGKPILTASRRLHRVIEELIPNSRRLFIIELLTMPFWALLLSLTAGEISKIEESRID